MCKSVTSDAPKRATRIEKDSLGSLEVPADAYYGVQTLRAIENFPITGYRIHPALIRAMAIVKKAAALANRDTGHLDAKIADAISAAAEGATPGHRLPRARTDGPYDFSFSGLKTAVLREVNGYRERGEPIPVEPIAAAFEEAVVDALATKTVAAATDLGVAAVALGGGVAANRSLRRELRERLEAQGLPLLIPPPAWCTDNGAMIGAAAGFRYLAGDRSGPELEAIPNLALPWLDR